jgi:hypothetical protein
MCKNPFNIRIKKCNRPFVLIAIFLIISLFTNISYSQNNFSAQWCDENFDTTAKALPLPDFLSNSGNSIFYIIGNDKENLIICLKIPDVFLQHKILHGGITLWIDLKDKKRKEVGIRFPIEKMAPKHFKEEQFTDVGVRRNKQIEQLNEIQLIGFKENKDRYIIPSNNPEEIHALIDYDLNGYLFYQLVVPFKKLPETGWNPDKLLSLGIETYQQNFSGPGMEGQGSERMYPGGQRGGPGGNDEGFGGGMGGRREMGGEQSDEDFGSGHQRNMQQSSIPVIFWIKKIKLASR